MGTSFFFLSEDILLSFFFFNIHLFCSNLPCEGIYSIAWLWTEQFQEEALTCHLGTGYSERLGTGVLLCGVTGPWGALKEANPNVSVWRACLSSVKCLQTRLLCCTAGDILEASGRDGQDAPCGLSSFPHLISHPPLLCPVSPSLEKSASLRDSHRWG